MFNNKGQSLVTFVLILPIFLFILILVIDISNMILLRRELDNINYIALDYGLKIMDEDDATKKISDVVIKNDNDIVIDNIGINNEKITLDIKKSYKGKFLGFIKVKIKDVKSSYIAYYLEDKKVIERNK